MWEGYREETPHLPYDNAKPKIITERNEKLKVKKNNNQGEPNSMKMRVNDRCGGVVGGKMEKKTVTISFPKDNSTNQHTNRNIPESTVS